MSPLDPEPPPVGEEIHLPGPSVVPILTAVGITLTLVGITTFIELTVVGAILTVGSMKVSGKGIAQMTLNSELGRRVPVLQHHSTLTVKAAAVVIASGTF